MQDYKDVTIIPVGRRADLQKEPETMARFKHNKWFEETFLPTLKDGQWLSEKQVAVCKKYMIEDRYTARIFLLYSGNMEFKVHEYRKGYGKFHKMEYPYNVEERVIL